MKKNKTNKLILLISILLLIGVTGCSSSTSTNTKKIEKLAFTKENIQKVLNNKYNIYGMNEYKGRILLNIQSENTTFTKEQAKKELKRIEKILNENISIKGIDDIRIKNKNNLLAISYLQGKIQIGEEPIIGNAYGRVPIYSEYVIGTKFDYLNPAEGIKIIVTDKEDGDITNKVKLENPEVLKTEGVQTLIYEVSDSDGNTVTDSDITVNVTR